MYGRYKSYCAVLCRIFVILFRRVPYICVRTKVICMSTQFFLYFVLPLLPTLFFFILFIQWHGAPLKFWQRVASATLFFS